MLGLWKVCITLAQCTKESCIQKYKAKQERKQAANETYLQHEQQHFNAKITTTVSSTHNDEEADEDYYGYIAGASFHQDEGIFHDKQAKVDNTLILLDSQSNHITFYVKRLLKNIQVAEKPLRMPSNGGMITFIQQADLPNYGVVWFNPDSIANIISMSEAERRGHKILYTPGCLHLLDPEQTFTMDFKMNKARLYAYKVPVQGTNLIQTVSENTQFFTPRQIEMAKQARNLHQMIGRPSHNDFLGIVKNNLLPNANITIKDVMHAMSIFGKELGSIQGKTVRKWPEVIVADYIQIPPDILKLHQLVTISADIMIGNSIQFLIMTSKDIQHFNGPMTNTSWI
jgi:hypothetical protein